MKLSASNFVGWFGVFCLLVAYAAVTFNILNPQTVAYLLLNIVGAGALAIETIAKRDLQPALLNIVWALVALIGLIQFFH